MSKLLEGANTRLFGVVLLHVYGALLFAVRDRRRNLRQRLPGLVLLAVVQDRHRRLNCADGQLDVDLRELDPEDLGGD